MAFHQSSDAIGAMLTAQLVAMRNRAARARPCELAEDLETIRRLATAHGYAAVLPVVHAFDHVLSRSVRRAPVDGWLSILSDAIDCGRGSKSSEATFAAICSSRLGV